MPKSTVYSWRLSPELKAELEAAARAEKVSISVLLDRIARDWLAQRAPDLDEEARARAILMKVCGSVSGDGISATNERVREVIGERLEAKYARNRPR